MDTRETVIAGDANNDSSGWMVAIIILILVIAGGAVWYFYQHRVVVQQQAAPAPAIQVNLPDPSASSDTSGGTGQPQAQ